MWNSSNKFQLMKTLLKRCENAMAKYTEIYIQKMPWIYICNYYLAFVIVNLFNVHHTATDQIN